MEKKPGITRRELSEALKINQSAIQKHIDKLKKEGIIRRVGPAKGGRWEVVE
jgi:ATP-dependent DNA helicase RecG